MNNGRQGEGEEGVRECVMILGKFLRRGNKGAEQQKGAKGAKGTVGMRMEGIFLRGCLIRIIVRGKGIRRVLLNVWPKSLTKPIYQRTNQNHQTKIFIQRNINNYKHNNFSLYNMLNLKILNKIPNKNQTKMTETVIPTISQIFCILKNCHKCWIIISRPPPWTPSPPFCLFWKCPTFRPLPKQKHNALNSKLWGLLMGLWHKTAMFSSSAPEKSTEECTKTT